MSDALNKWLHNRCISWSQTASTLNVPTREVEALLNEITRLRAASEDFAKMVLGDETYNNSPCQAHPFELVFQEIEKTTDKVTADWSERCQKLEAQRDRLLTLATKWCDQSHHDWAEIKRMADSA